MTPVKYIIVRKHHFETAILLMAPVNHAEAVNRPEVEKGAEIMSAGYFYHDRESGVVVDKDMPSTTLNLRPRPQDAEIIERTLILMGFRPALRPATRS